MDDVTPPKVPEPELRILTVAEAQLLLETAKGTDFHLPIHLAIHTGLRRSELCGVVWFDVDLEARTLTVARTMVSLKGDPTHISEPKSRASRRNVVQARMGHESIQTTVDACDYLLPVSDADAGRVLKQRLGNLSLQNVSNNVQLSLIS